MRVLGISAFFHDAAAALVVDGDIVMALEEERLTRIKHDPSLPVHSIAKILDSQGIGIDDLDAIVFYEKPLRKFDRILQGHLGQFPRGFKRFSRALPSWLSRRLWVEHELATTLDCDPDKIRFSTHHLSHAASAFYPSPFQSAAVLTVDGVGEWASAGLFHGRGTALTALSEQRYPHSLGLLYSAITAYLGFEVNEGEYKVMGLSSYGEPRFRREFDQLVRVGDDGTVQLDLSFFAFQHSHEASFSPRLEELFGPARRPDDDFDPRRDTRYADIASTLQLVTEEAVLKMARHALRTTGERRLVMAGGVALNSVANGRLARELELEDGGLYVHPAAGDAGGAVGAALWASHTLLGVERRTTTPRTQLGPSFDDPTIEEILTETRARFVRLDSEAAVDREVAARLARGEVGAFFQGAAEWGPRALGARSILADPRRAEMTAFVNEKVKFREPFRPFAPACLADEAPLYFDLVPNDRHLAPYMLTVVPVTELGQRVLPATTHVDKTARVQVVDAATSPRFAQLLTAFAVETGVGCLLNTSFNLRGEPMCATPLDALSTFTRSALDFLAIGSFIVTRDHLHERAEAA
jgi:carbamoyltransferase